MLVVIHAVGELHATVLLRRSHRCPWGPWLGATGLAAWLCETIVAFARWYLRGVETGIAFAGEKWVFLVRFSGAEVMAVSMVPCCGCAVVLLVSTSPCF